MKIIALKLKITKSPGKNEERWPHTFVQLMFQEN